MNSVRRVQRPPAGVGLMAGLFAFVALSALFMGGAALSADADRTNRIIAIGMFVSLLASSVVLARSLFLAVFGSRIAARRWSRINRELHDLGFRDAVPHEVSDTLGLPVQVLAPYMLARRRGGGIDHLTLGEVDGREIRCFNVRIRGGGWVDVPAVAMKIDASLSATVIRPFKSPIAPRPDMKRALFEHEEFNRSVAVFSVDAFFASAMVDARMMDWLRRNLRRTTIELADRWVIAWNWPGRRFGRRPLELIDLLLDFDGRIPRALPSLFPGRHDHTRWRHRAARSSIRAPVDQARSERGTERMTVRLRRSGLKKF